MSKYASFVFLAAAWMVPGIFPQQGNDAVVVGSVFDPTRAGVAGAAVTLTHLATNAVTQVVHS